MAHQDNWLDPLVAPQHHLQQVTDGIQTAIPAAASTYDKKAALYDRTIGNPVYNRLVWGASTADYANFAAAAVNASDGPLLDAGCGTAVFTAPVYQASARPIVLVDSSIGMLERAHRRITATGNAKARFVQANLFDLPFRPHSFATVACYGILHLFDDVEAALHALCSQLASGGTVYATSLVAETRRGGHFLNILHRAGEAAAPRTAAQLTNLARRQLGDSLKVQVIGSMAFLTAQPETAGTEDT